MLSPHHADRDYRVRRSIEVVADFFDELNVFWDKDYVGHKNEQNYPAPHIQEKYCHNKSYEFVRLLFKQQIFNQDIFESVLSSDYVYIHASGIEGLLYCRAVKQIKPSCFVIFDYHDSLTYELFYQLKKLRLSYFFKPIWGLYKYYIHNLMNSVDALIGISKTQTNDFQQLLGKQLVTASVPNFRAFTDCSIAPVNVGIDDEIALVWLGSVMKGRDLSLLANWINQLSITPHLHVFGNIINPSVVSDLQLLLGNKVSFYGEFKNEKDIYMVLPSKPLGVFLGWDDPQETDINSHASPNKYFTYINMELPVIINQSLTELAEDVINNNAGVVVSDPHEFSQAIQEISDNYSNYIAGVRKLKQHYSEIDPKQLISAFLRKIK